MTKIAPQTLDKVLTMVYKLFMVNVVRSEQFDQWLRGLRDRQAIQRISARFLRIENTGNLGDFHGVGDGVSELRFFFGPGYRVYFIFQDTDIVLLCGGDHSSQEADIRLAKQEAQRWRE